MADGKEKESRTPEFEPPQACVQRVIKSVLPDTVQLGKEAKAAFARSAGIFIMYLTACANDFCRESKRSTISAQDVLQAIKELDFPEFEQPLQDYLEAFRKEASTKKRVRASGAGSSAKKPKTEKEGGEDEEEEEEEAEPLDEEADADGEGEFDKKEGEYPQGMDDDEEEG